ncbi:type II toxin-antitoxin system RelE/ParE family toxin [Candidatus Methylospira mobilis]|uniref:type II toxin-antitoxin system RelE/ParE family toxin n=1 Tax=Candidatus Methylospira mobilis TaxID=1808979 RepID=UPI0028EBA773|nr:type II toxin-antitoxin system RelE/ParE family toxin [Candidatus Methylospira mobilis]WNV03379.1 type II toxin-antitoxin system RelE/ParE family toxin [Candidatus Methylospira mobilis]
MPKRSNGKAARDEPPAPLILKGLEVPFITKRPRAKSDLVEIWDYIAEDSEARADDFIDRIDQKFRTLAQRPGIGRLRDELAADVRSSQLATTI